MNNKIETNPIAPKDAPVEKSEINLQFHLYMFTFLITYLLSWLIPGLIMWLFLSFYYIPYVLENPMFISLFLNLNSIIPLIFLPLVIIICYLIHLFVVALITRIWWRITEIISPSKDGKIPRNIPSKTLNIYHLRSFLIKYPKHAFNKGPFPWLINWLYNFVGTNKIGKGSVLEEQFGADKFVEIGKNCYIGVNSGFSSHAVDGIFGNVDYFKIKLGDNVTTSGLNALAPGVEIHDNAYLLPMAGATKHNILKGDNYYFGLPLRKVFSRKIGKYLKISKEDLKRAEDLRNSIYQDTDELHKKSKESDINRNK